MFKLWGETINIREQQDAFDFFQAIIDQIDEQIKVSNTTDLPTFLFIPPIEGGGGYCFLFFHAYFVSRKSLKLYEQITGLTFEGVSKNIAGVVSLV